MTYARPYEITLPDQTLMKGCCWLVPSSKANVVIVTGMAEASYRYEEFALYLNQHEYSVYCIDHYGQGLNTEEPDDMGVWPKDGFAKAVEMVQAEVEQVRKLGKPVYLLGHSMGSFVTQEFIQKHSTLVDKVILSGSCGKRFLTRLGGVVANTSCLFHDRDQHRAKTMHKMTFGSYNKKIKNPRTPSDWLSHNEMSVDDYLADFRCSYVPTAGFYQEFMRGLNRLHKAKSVARVRKDLPLLLIAGTADPVGNYGKGVRKLQQMYAQAGLKHVEMHLYDDYRHEVLNEIGREQVYRDVLTFLDHSF